MKEFKVPFRKSSKKTSVVPQVPYTVFNFRDADARSENKFRRINQVVAGIIVVALAATGLWGLRANSDAASSRDAVEEAFADRTVAQQQLRELTGGADDLPSHIAARRAQIGAALSSDTDIGAVIADVLSSAPVGVEVTRVEVSGVVTASTAEGAPIVPDITNEGAEVADPPDVPRTVSVTATSPDFDAPVVWRNTLASLGYLTELVVDPSSGSQGTVSLSISATINPGEMQSRRLAAAADIGSLPTKSPAPGQSRGGS